MSHRFEDRRDGGDEVVGPARCHLVRSGQERPGLVETAAHHAHGAAIALTAAAVTVARRAGLIGRPARWLSPATWAISGYLALNTVGNFVLPRCAAPVHRGRVRSGTGSVH